jgi:hypothetical protein
LGQPSFGGREPGPLPLPSIRHPPRQPSLQRGGHVLDAITSLSSVFVSPKVSVDGSRPRASSDKAERISAKAVALGTSTANISSYTSHHL